MGFFLLMGFEFVSIVEASHPLESKLLMSCMGWVFRYCGEKSWFVILLHPSPTLSVKSDSEFNLLLLMLLLSTLLCRFPV